MATTFADFLASDDARLGLSLLAAGGPSTVPMSFGQRIAGAVDQFQQGRDANEDRKFRRALMQSQIDENASQADTRKAALAKAQQGLDFERMFLFGDGSAPGASGGGSVSSSGLLGGAPSAGGPAAPTTPAPAGAPFGGMSARQISERYRIPLDQVIADYKFNGGKKIAEFISDRTKPNWQQQGGNWVNTNDPSFRGGIQDQVIASPNGSVGVLRGGESPTFGLVPGSIGAVGTLEDTRNASGARYAPGKGTIGADGRPQPTSVAEDLGTGSARGGTPPVLPVLPGRPFGAPAPGMAGRMGPTNAAERGMAGQVADTLETNEARLIEGLRRDLATPGAIRDPRDRANAEAYLAQLTGGAGSPRPAGVTLPGRPLGATAAPPMAADGTGIGTPGGTDFSPAEKAAQAAVQARQVKTAEADVVRDTEARTKTKNAVEMLGDITRARELLKMGPTGSGIGSLVDAMGNQVGYTTDGAEVASRLDPIAGNLTKNIPRMEGPQSDGDREEYKTQAGRVANRSLPPKQRLAALDEVERIQRKYAPLNTGETNGGGKSIVKTGMLNGRKVVKYSDGSTAYAD
ncbi:hypothetical protein J7E62_09185 [Variovorax paradoxus]|nr:hypothetical protein [Variovorax paradoxus]